MKEEAYKYLTLNLFLSTAVVSIPLLIVQSLIFFFIFLGLVNSKNKRQDEVEKKVPMNAFKVAIIWSVVYLFISLLFSILSGGLYGIYGFLTPVFAGLLTIAVKNIPIYKDITKNGEGVEMSSYINFSITTVLTILIMFVVSILVGQFIKPIANLLVQLGLKALVPQLDTALSAMD
jgi:hypothetical protein